MRLEISKQAPSPQEGAVVAFLRAARFALETYCGDWEITPVDGLVTVEG